jgi:hypothetical protein
MRFFSLPLSLSLAEDFATTPATHTQLLRSLSAFQKYCTLVTIYRQAAQNGLNSVGFGLGFRV